MTRSKLQETGMALLLAGTALGAFACGGCGKEEEEKKPLDCSQGTHQEGDKCVDNPVAGSSPAANVAQPPQQGTPVGSQSAPQKK